METGVEFKELVIECPSCRCWTLEYRPVYAVYWCNNLKCKYVMGKKEKYDYKEKIGIS